MLQNIDDIPTMETLPNDIFGHVLDFLDHKEHSLVPVCSKPCRLLWLDFADNEIRRLEKEFARKFRFEDESSTTQRYHAIVKAYKRYQTDSLKMLHADLIEGNVKSEFELVGKVESLLHGNPVLSSESMMLVKCSILLRRALRLIPFEPLEKNSPDPHVMAMAYPLVKMTFDRLKPILEDNSRAYCEIGVTYYMCLLKNDLFEEASQVLKSVLFTDPFHTHGLAQFAHMQMHNGRPDISFEIMKDAVFSACEGTGTQINLGDSTTGICATFLRYAPIYGIGRCIETLREAIRLLEEEKSRLITLALEETDTESLVEALEEQHHHDKACILRFVKVLKDFGN